MTDDQELTGEEAPASAGWWGVEPPEAPEAPQMDGMDLPPDHPWYGVPVADWPIEDPPDKMLV